LEILKNILYDDSQLYLKVCQDGKFEWWKCKDYFEIKNSIIYFLNQRTYTVESWIGFSTGKILKAEISEM